MTAYPAPRDPAPGLEGSLAAGKPPLHLAPPAAPERGAVRAARPARSMREANAALAEQKQTAAQGTDPSGTANQHKRGKLTARERIDLLLDPGTFVELQPLVRHRATGFGMADKRPYTDGVVTGWGLVEGRKVFVFAHDFRIFGGALGERFASKIHKLMALAESTGAPVIGLNDGGGARIQEGILGLAGFGGIFAANTRASGVIPQISVMLGPCAGGAAYSPALTDFVFMVRGTSNMFITGPDVVRAVTGESITLEELGGADLHANHSGVASFVLDDEQSCLQQVRYLLSYLPSNNTEAPPRQPTEDRPDRLCDALLDLVPGDPTRAYDVRDVIAEIVDDGEFLEVRDQQARNVVCALAHLDGHVVGIVANQPQHLAGALDIDASEKAARFVRTCDAFNIPLISLVDVPGFMPGADQEHQGIIRRGAKLLYAYCEATVPRIQLIMRKAYGGAYIVMDSKAIGSDLCYAWPTNEIAVMGAEAATKIIHRRELAAEGIGSGRHQELIAEYEEELLTPYVGAEHGLIDDVIDPSMTRIVLIQALDTLRNKSASLPRRKHGNIPL